MPADLEEYKQHKLALERFSSSASPTTAMLIGGWANYRNLSNPKLCKFIVDELGQGFVIEAKDYLHRLWRAARAGAIAIEKTINSKILTAMDQDLWDHEDVTLQGDRLEHLSWLSISTLGGLQLFLQPLSRDEIRIVGTLMSSVDIADYVDQMEIGQSTDYPTSEMEIQRTFLAMVEGDDASTLDINSYPSTIRLKGMPHEP